MSLSNWFENVIMNHLFGQRNYATQDLYLGLCSNLPAESSSGGSCNEIGNSGAYSRYYLPGSYWTLAAGGLISNSQQIQFLRATTNWGWIRAWVLTNSSGYGGGYVLFYGALSPYLNIYAWDEVTINAGQLQITLE